MDIILLVMAVTFLVMTIYTNMMVKKQQKQYQEKMDEYREKYAYLDSQTFDQLDNVTLRNAIVARITLKKEEHVNLKKHLTHGEQVIYTFFLVENAFRSGRGSLYDFFITEQSKPFIDMVVSVYHELGCHEVADIMIQAIALNDKYLKEEAGEEVEYTDDELTFADFNQQYKTVSENVSLSEKIDTYIREHKEEFIDGGK